MGLEVPQEGQGDAGELPLTFDVLVAQVKEMQRRDPLAREQWNSFTDFGGGGKRDPAKHSPQFLAAFLQHLSSGAAKMVPEEDTIGMAEAVKLMQKKSPSFKSIWATFCMQFGGGKNDPVKHEAAYHVKFFDYLAQQAALGVAMNPLDPATVLSQGLGQPLKRMRDSAGAALVTGFLEPGKEELVQRVKNFQRMGEPQKELWGTYADLYLGGIRDPGRHDAATLDEFCRNHQVPELNVARPEEMPWAGGKGGGGTIPSAMPFTMPMGASAEPMDPEKEALAARARAFQQQGEEQPEFWGAFPGLMRDPGRQEQGTLQEFIQTHSVS